MKVNGKIIIVTGGGSGMGRELTILLVSKGAKVIIADIREKAMLETADLAGADSVHPYVPDISDRTAVESFHEHVMAEHKMVDGLINNAGIIQPFIHVDELDYHTIERIMNINFYGTLFMAKPLYLIL
ncbi:MAG: SDR family NAD(P)-dependent oxidoreductase [Flavobacteriales bacterium]|nr:SDR family NAD(P)-dependent oxidoreductase [Flavobacteriales bacterium]